MTEPTEPNQPAPQPPEIAAAQPPQPPDIAAAPPPPATPPPAALGPVEPPPAPPPPAAPPVPPLGAGSPPPGPRPPIYPMITTFDETVTMSRLWGIPLLGIMVRWFLLIPHYVVLAFYGIVVVLLQFVIWIPVLVNGQYPAWGYSIMGGFIRWVTRVQAYAILAAAAYPPLSTGGRHDVDVRWDESQPVARWAGIPLIGVWIRSILLIPHLIILYFLGDRRGVPEPGHLDPRAPERALRRLGLPDHRRLHPLAEPDHLLRPPDDRAISSVQPRRLRSSRARRAPATPPPGGRAHTRARIARISSP